MTARSEMQPQTSYDALRYPGHFYAQSSPDRLATLATLSGLRTAPIEACRVLELGCGEGGNLIPLADRFRDSRFVGIDLSAASIDRGKHVIQALGLKNIELRAQDILAYSAASGAFDYIISHGVLSWVPEHVRQRILDICVQCLAPNGVAYLSYDVLPGGYLRNVPRDLMRFHTRHISDAASKVRAAREIVDFVGSAIPAGTLERELLKQEMRPYEGKDYVLYHDLLAEVKDPIYFLDFMDAASRCGLQFVSEANLHYARTAHLPEHVRKQLDGLASRLEREQYLDFIHVRSFRQTILCRDGHKLDLAVTPERLEQLLISSAAKPTQPVTDARDSKSVEFRRGESPAVTHSDPVSKALVVVLGEAYPRGLRYSELRDKACAKLGTNVAQLTPADDAKMIQMLISSFVNDVVELHMHQFDFCTSVSSRPTMGALARLQAEQGSTVVSAKLDVAYLQPGLMRNLAVLLDGSRDFEGLLIDLAARMSQQEQERLNPENVRRTLEAFAANALLIA